MSMIHRFLARWKLRTVDRKIDAILDSTPPGGPRTWMEWDCGNLDDLLAERYRIIQQHSLHGNKEDG